MTTEPAQYATSLPQRPEDRATSIIVAWTLQDSGLSGLARLIADAIRKAQEEITDQYVGATHASPDPKEEA